MKKQDLTDILNGHAAMLIAEDSDQEGDASDILLARYPEESAELAPLFKLASDLKEVLKPVVVPDFRSQLRQELESYQSVDVIIGQSKDQRKRRWFVVAAAGSALSAMGLILVLIRRLRGSQNRKGNAAPTAV